MEIYLPKDPYKPKLSSTLQLIEVYCLSTLYSTEVSNSSSLPVFIAFSEFQHGERDENKLFTITGSEVENIAPATVGDTARGHCFSCNRKCLLLQDKTCLLWQEDKSSVATEDVSYLA